MNTNRLRALAGLPLVESIMRSPVVIQGETINPTDWWVVDLDDGGLVAGPSKSFDELVEIWDEQLYADNGKLLQYPSVTGGLVAMTGSQIIAKYSDV
jgi:hypothetical protein